MPIQWSINQKSEQERVQRHKVDNMATSSSLAQCEQPGPPNHTVNDASPVFLADDANKRIAAREAEKALHDEQVHNEILERTRRQDAADSAAWKAMMRKLNGPKKPACETRPGLDKNGKPRTKTYGLVNLAEDAAWLQRAATDCALTVSRMVVGVASGLWSIPWFKIDLGTASENQTTLSIQIRDDEWDAIAANATWWSKENTLLNPVQFCVASALGQAKVRYPGPVLLTNRGRWQLSHLHEAITIAHMTRPFLGVTPPFQQLESCCDRLEQGILKTGRVCETELFKRLAKQVEELRQMTENCQNTNLLWRSFLETADAIITKQ